MLSWQLLLFFHPFDSLLAESYQEKNTFRCKSCCTKQKINRRQDAFDFFADILDTHQSQNSFSKSVRFPRGVFTKTRRFHSRVRSWVERVSLFICKWLIMCRWRGAILRGGSQSNSSHSSESTLRLRTYSNTPFPNNWREAYANCHHRHCWMVT